MHITLNNVGKRFNKEWIFKGIQLELTNAHKYVVLGGNGSGKSTLLQVIAGFAMPSEGTLTYALNQQTITSNTLHRYVAMATPVLELYEQLTLKECIDFHFQLKSIKNGLLPKQLPRLMYLEKSIHQPIRTFSSGMKQRLKLSLAIFSDVPLLLLDEPTSNLDRKAIAWYQQTMAEYATDQLVIVCSNQQEHEYNFCDQFIEVETYK